MFFDGCLTINVKYNMVMTYFSFETVRRNLTEDTFVRDDYRISMRDNLSSISYTDPDQKRKTNDFINKYLDIIQRKAKNEQVKSL